MALESKRSVFLSASLFQSRDRSVLQRFGATERPTAICKLAPSSVASSAAERRELRRLERETPLLISKEMKLIKQIVSTAAAGRATTPPLLTPPSERDGGSMYSKGKVEDDSGVSLDVECDTCLLAPNPWRSSVSNFRVEGANRLRNPSVYARHATPRDIHARSRPAS